MENNYGLIHIRNTFDEARQKKNAALMPYITMGYPTIEDSVNIIREIARAGADMIELGIPFSDPLADGAVIQASTQVALGAGMSVRKCLDMVAQLRQEGIGLPFIMMGYINPLIAYGMKNFIRDAHQAGVDGFIIPDLPVDEAEEVMQLCQQFQLGLSFLATPNTPTERLKKLAECSRGFMYLVSVIGVTGVRDQLSESLEGFINTVRGLTDIPLAVGFGISSSHQVDAVGRMADGVIIGSALIKAINATPHPIRNAYLFIREKNQALIKHSEDDVC